MTAPDEVLEAGEYRYRVVEGDWSTHSGVVIVDEPQTRDETAGLVLDRLGKIVTVSDSATVELTAVPVYDEVPW
ncbi:hypothetical protein [Catenuloplanes japonicus]|uniref:hypothetical protein n=1 Tax=Catenuloplanes japonicus TaxID=33876 RepID=UPI0005277019|nr:hypothetical protein [Catenuloplanes japonicus]